MKRPGDHAWCFVHPDLDRRPGNGNSQASGLRLTPRGGIDLVSDDQAVRQAVLMLLSTRPGERLMRPEYGCNLHQLVFAPNNDTTAAIAVYHVRRALQRFEPRVDILRLDAGPDPKTPNLLLITLEYQVRTTRSRDEVQLSLDLAGA
jgi:phage baseplate assembly protein W